jgi:coenzyme F420-0:L-glutamate ligase/coenzyme F420-1:gamma-L-glutamate ligase
MAPMNSSPSPVTLIPIAGLPEIQPGDALASLIAVAIRSANLDLLPGDVLVLGQKIVSKAEGRIVLLDSLEPSERASTWAAEFSRDPRVVELVLRESRRIVRMERGVLIVETAHGFVCANAGVDVSNTPSGTATLLPIDPDASARRLRLALAAVFGCGFAVIIADTFGRPWREGLVNVAVGISGLAPLDDFRGRNDPSGRPLQSTVVAVADELAAVAGLVMGKLDRVPAAIVRGYAFRPAEDGVAALIRPASSDLFR